MPLTIALLTVGDHDTQGLSRLGKVMEVRSRRNMLDNGLWLHCKSRYVLHQDS